MSNDIISSIIIAASAFVTGVVTTLIGKIIIKPKGIKIKKSKFGLYSLPTAFACASCKHEQVIQLHDEYKAEFDFTPNEFLDNIPDFVSIVFKYHDAVSVSKVKHLNFDLKFGEGIFTGIDVEFHPEDTGRYGIWKKNISRAIGWQHYSIPLEEVAPQLILRNLKEICFVVTNSHFPDISMLSGDFEVKNVQWDE